MNVLKSSDVHNPSTEPYSRYLATKKRDLFLKVLFDKCLAIALLIILLPIFIILSVWIVLDSKGPVFFRQERVTKNGKLFRIFKFRTMVVNAEQCGSLVTIGNDKRITKVGAVIRKYRLDELPQLFNVLLGDMSFVGVRPEVQKYVLHYTDEMMATLLLPAGITSPASIAYKDEDEIMTKYTSRGMNPDDAYLSKVLPEKMRYNLEYIGQFTFLNDITIMIDTVLKVFR